MSIFSRLFGKSTSFSTSQLEEIAAAQGIGGLSVANPEAALKVSAVLCAVRVISEGMAQMPLMIRRREIRAGREMNPVARDHPAWRLFNLRPNEWQTPYEFVEHAVMCAALTGDFLALKVQDGRGEVRELLPVLAGAWSVEQGQDFALTYRVSYAQGRYGEFRPDQVFHLRGPSWNGYKGLDPVRLAAVTVGLAKALESHQSKLAANGGRPSGILAFPDALSPEVKKGIRTAWASAYGANGEGGVAVLDKGAKFDGMTMTSVDAQHLETRRFQIEEIARIFRVFPIMLMQMDKSATFAGAEQNFRAHVIHTLGPWMRRVEQAINTQIIADDTGTVFADFDERELLRGDTAVRAAYQQAALGGSGAPAWMTQNEVRESEGLDPSDSPGADVLNSERGSQPETGGAGDGA